MSPECRQLAERLGHAPMPAALEEHARSCASCQSVLQAFAELGAAPAVAAASPDVSSLLHERARAELAAAPRASPWWREMLWLIALALIVAGLGTWLMRGTQVVQNRAPPPVLVTVALLLMAVIGWGLYAAAVPRGRFHRIGVLIFAGETALLVALGGSGLDVRPFSIGTHCLMTECALSLAPLLLVGWLLTRSAYDPLRTLSAGLAAGATGMLTLHLHCPIGTVAHLMTFHIAPWLGLTALLWAVRSRLRSRSFAP